MTAENSPALPLRERKKQRTRQTLIDTALDLFGAHGFDGVTLDGLCEAAEVSKRTFFRYFAGKEDVAMSPTQDLWTTFLDVLESCPADGRPLLALFEDALAEAIGRMPADGWAERALAGRRLAALTPSMDAHCLAFCDRTTRSALAVAERRFSLPGPDDPLRARLALDLLVVLFNRALDAWVAQPTGHTAEDLARRLRATSAELPSALATTAEPHA
ncbi:helix-turn-helix domain-containing protein [Streptomyces sp. NPDC096079]|uniref:TetR/AcrR family transcriptional regulator n=1 Tax=unclassified Streptomyces TaxID=2593676 RepID=UPI0033339F05